MVSRAIKGCSNNKDVPMTGFMSIELVDHQLILTTTDASNYLFIFEDKVEGEDFEVVVQADTFAKLVAKTTTENISLELNGEELTVTGNGKYRILLPLDAEGQLIKFPKPLDDIDLKSGDYNKYDVNLTTIRTLLTVNKPALAPQADIQLTPQYTAYYVGESVVSTDSYKICGTAIKLFDEPVLITAPMMDLLDVMNEEEITTYINGNTIVFTTKDCIVYGKSMEGIDTYKIDAIQGLLDLDFPSDCTVSKGEILQALDRLALFVGPYDKNGITLTFTKDGLMLSSLKSSGTETVEYRASNNFKEFSACINIEMLQTQIKSHILDDIQICYGLDTALKIIDGNVTQIVAFIEV